MAISFDNDNVNIEVIASIDPAIVANPEAYKEYIEDLDENKLEFDEDAGAPTRFVMRKILPYGVQKSLRNEQASVVNGQVSINLGSMIEQVRVALVNIKDPGEGLEYRRGHDGNANTELIEKLGAVGIVEDLYNAHTKNTKSLVSSKKN